MGSPKYPALVWTKVAAGALALVAVATTTAESRAACCPGFAQQCAGTKSVWCVQNAAPAGTLPQAFCPYGDEVVSELETLFNIQAPGTFEFDVDWPPTGGAHTGTDCSTFGDSVTGDAFGGNAYGVTGFWGYLLALHEAINDWTGMSTPGWPTDYWADHVSGFPNEMDWRIMGTLGTSLGDANLIAASPAQKARFWPGGDSADSRVQMFDNIFILPKMGDGYSGYSHIFSLIQKDGLNWNNVATNGANPDERRSEYVAAYLSLGAGQSVLPILQMPSPGYSASAQFAVCNGQWDGVAGDPNPSYTCSEANIDAIATAHCAIAANGRPVADLSALQSGNYADVHSGPCGSTCPGECACDSIKSQCVAPWLAASLVSDAGAGNETSAPEADASGSGAGSSGTGTTSSGGTSSGGTLGTSSGGTSGSSSGGPADGGQGAASVGSSSSGCSCSALGREGGDFPPSGKVALALAALGAVVRRRKRGE